MRTFMRNYRVMLKRPRKYCEIGTWKSVFVGGNFSKFEKHAFGEGINFLHCSQVFMAV